LIEVIVAMVILAIAVSSLAPLVYSVSRSTLKNTGNAYRNGVLMQEVNRLVALPFADVTVGSASYANTSPPYPHYRVVTVTQPAANVKVVKVLVTPTSSGFKPDSATFTRTLAATSKYLCTTCQ
jgi:hypothetical protein